MKKIFIPLALVTLGACSGTHPPLAPTPSEVISTPVESPKACAFDMTVLDASPNRDGRAYLKVRNDDSCERRVGLAVYKAINRYADLTQDNQELFADVNVVVQSGETVELRADLPDCEYQYDPYHTRESAGRRPDFGQGEELFDISRFSSYFGGSRCVPPPPPPPTLPPPTVPPTVPPPPIIPPTVPPPTTPPPPIVPPPPVVPPPSVCPVLTSNNWRQYVTNYKVINESATTAYANFTVTLPPGCTIPLSVVSYRIATCKMKFPQTFIHGSTPAGTPYGAGVYTQQMRVTKVGVEYQVDLRVEGFTWGQDLTQENENSYYKTRTLAWIVDKECL